MTPISVEAPTPPDLKGRSAKCHCGAVKPSGDVVKWAFTYTGTGSPGAAEICKCGYHFIAHTVEGMAGNAPSNRRTVIEQGKCSGFVARGPLEFDRFWCGCGNTD